MRIALAVVPVLLVSQMLGCGSVATTSARQDALDKAIARDERRAAVLRSDSLKLKNRLLAQSKCIAYRACSAKAAAIEAEVASSLASCNKQASDWYRCDAKRSNRTAGGCLFGILAAGLTGGAAAPAAAIGCAGGGLAGHATAKGDCTRVRKPRACGRRGLEFQNSALANHRLAAFPQCGAEPIECGQLERLSSPSR